MVIGDGYSSCNHYNNLPQGDPVLADHTPEELNQMLFWTCVAAVPGLTVSCWLEHCGEIRNVFDHLGFMAAPGLLAYILTSMVITMRKRT